MGGCFGNDPIDKWLERQVDEYNDKHYDNEEEDDDDIYGDDDDL